MKSVPLSPSEEAAWCESIRRRELVNGFITLQKISENLQFTEDFANEAPVFLAKVISETSKMVAICLENDVPSQYLTGSQYNTH